MRVLVLCSVWALVLGLPFSLGCGSETSAVVPVVAPPVVEEVPPDPSVLATRAVPLTIEAREIRRIREEHQGLIASIPPTPVATPTLTVVEKQEVAVARVLAHPDGVPVGPAVAEDWFDPALGLSFFRRTGGDWTARAVREKHSHRGLFYYPGYPSDVPNFDDGSIFGPLSREMVFGAVDVLPLLGEPTPATIAAFQKNLGWELVDSPRPVVNLWTTFVLASGGEVFTYAVGGVMEMGVNRRGEGAGLLEYVVPGKWLGPVVVERLS